MQELSEQSHGLSCMESTRHQDILQEVLVAVPELKRGVRQTPFHLICEHLINIEEGTVKMQKICLHACRGWLNIFKLFCVFLN